MAQELTATRTTGVVSDPYVLLIYQVCVIRCKKIFSKVNFADRVYGVKRLIG